MPPALRAVEDPHPTPLKVLILDDERFDRHRLARLCSGLDRHCTVTNAATLAAFETALEAARFDLIMLDYQLPDGTGLDALARVRMSARNCTAGILMVTGQGHDDIARRAIEDGCSDYLTKDELTKPTFERAVANALQKSALAVKLESQTFRRAEVEAVLEHFAGQCARDIKPMLSRMMRQLRDLQDDTSAVARFQRQAIEESCMDLWHFLLDLERHQGKTLFADLKPIAPVPAPQLDRVQPVSRKPPSPFRRPMH